MKKPSKLHSLYTRTGTSKGDTTPDFEKSNGVDTATANGHAKSPPRRFPKPSIFQRAQLLGILYRPRDVVFLFQMVFAAFWALIRLHYIELPYHLLTRFKYSTKQHPAAWSWWTSVFFATMRACSSKGSTIGQVRFIGVALSIVMSLKLLFVRKVKITRDVKFKVKLDVLLRPERATLFEVREGIRTSHFFDEVLHPSEEYLKSMHPQGPNAPLANLPEEVGDIDPDGTYTLKGEWIEALDDGKTSESGPAKPRSKTVILYFHGGAYTFCSPRTHTHMLAKLAKAVGPGTRVFSVDYRRAPEHPFPAAIHDAFAAYLYLTEPNHAALVLNESSAVEELSVDPKDIVVAGDSAGGNLATAFMLYMARYVQPSTEPRFLLPHATLLLSPWVDVTSSLAGSKSFESYCYCPGPLGTTPFDKKTYTGFKKHNFASYYICGDHTLVLNNRNALGVDRRWEWYSHIAQHPLVSPAFANRGFLRGLTNTLVQTASHDRLVDESRLYAHRLGLENSKSVTRIEVYKDMVHVHQALSLIFRSANIAIQNLARFIERSEYLRDEQEREMSAKTVMTDQDQNGDHVSGRRTYAAMLRKTPVRSDSKPDVTIGDDAYVPAFKLPTMVRDKDSFDGVEWVVVEQNGREYASDEGVPVQSLKYAWPSHNSGNISTPATPNNTINKASLATREP
ncbi:hypothetical protein BGZ79_008059 [Entomortierella chlamydospora]|nr:hypothetical protein BGZ79_008059 [Entomortierella chlamydospora]